MNGSEHAKVDRHNTAAGIYQRIHQLTDNLAVSILLLTGGMT